MNSQAKAWSNTYTVLLKSVMFSEFLFSEVPCSHHEPCSRGISALHDWSLLGIFFFFFLRIPCDQHLNWSLVFDQRLNFVALVTNLLDIAQVILAVF